MEGSGGFVEAFGRELKRASRYARPLTVAMADLDGFKAHNDHYGHPAGAVETPIGLLPTPEALDAKDLRISQEGWQTLLGVDRSGWLDAARRQSEWFEKFGARTTNALWEEQASLIRRLKESTGEFVAEVAGARA